MTNHIINSINNVVSEDANLFLLGDLLFHKKEVENYSELLDRFVCNNIYLLFGNHCNQINMNKLQHHKIKYLNHYLEIEVDKQLVCMSHYPMDNWNDRHGVSYMLHGHVHGKLNNNQIPKRLDVGIDSAKLIFGEYKPFSWNEINNLLK